MKTLPITISLTLLALGLAASAQSDFPLVDYHVHLKGDFTYDKAVEHSRQTGIKYGVALNCGLGFPTQTDSAALAWLESMKNSPFLLAMQAEGREWVKMFSPEVIRKFDYVFTDAMTYTDDSGKRVRLWIKEEVTVPDKEKFMDELVNRIETILGTEPIDIYVNPTFLPECISSEYNQLWTEERMLRVIRSAIENNVAIEINNRYRIPSEKFIKLAKKEGAKFSFGTNNADSNLGDLNWCLRMKKLCGLTAGDMFKPTGKD
ncbi:MAG TPA: hypothetical protein DC042_10050 [Bacteroidales bacterium]|nr:hypothetical protein [Bacteroidales bacterium]